MFSAVGLALDLVGAIALVFGLFTYSSPLSPGWLRTPEDYPHDAAFGVVGALFLAAGFALQSLTYYGYRLHTTHDQNLTGGLTFLAGGSLLAYFIYGGLNLFFLGREQRRVRGQEYVARDPEFGYWTRRKRRGLRWWKQEAIAAPSAESGDHDG